MKSFVVQLTKKGIKSGMNATEQKRIIITNYILFVASIVAFGRIYLFYVSGDVYYSLISLSSSLLFLFAYYLNIKGYFDYAKFTLLIVGNAAVLFKELASGGLGNQMFLIIASFSVIFLLFDVKEKFKLITALMIPTISTIIAVFFPNIISEPLQIEHHTMLLEKFFGVVSAIVIIVLVTWYFVKKSYDAETGLIESNEKLKKLNSEISIQKEKIELLYEKSDKLLLNILPEPIATRLKEGETQIADYFDEASIIFIDIVQFTQLTKQSKPHTVVSELNRIFTMFDKLSEKHGIEKIKTLGDCYMAVSGIPEPNKDHAVQMARLAVDAMEIMNGYKTRDGYEIKFRIGIDCGPVVAGVIGEKKFIYDLWGEPVNTASRMKDFGVVDEIQCTKRFIKKVIESSVNEKGNDEFQFIERDEIEIKGMGKMKPYFLIGRQS